MNAQELKEAAIQSLKNPGKAVKPLPKDESHPPILYIFRHCQTYDNVRRIFSGRRQTHLTEKGKRQAQELAKKMEGKKIDLFISPPLTRCKETLKPIIKNFPHTKVLIKADLYERDYGELTGKSKLRMMKLYPEKTVLWRRSWDVAPPGGESIKNVWETRMKKFCQWLENKIKREKINVAYVSTNNTMRLARMYFEKLSIKEMLTLENPYGDYAAYSLGDK